MSLTAFRRGSSGVRRAHTCRPSCLRYRRRRRTLDGVESENGPAKQSRVAPTPLSVSSHSPKFVFFFKKKKAKRNRRHFYWVSPYDTLMTSLNRVSVTVVAVGALLKGNWQQCRAPIHQRNIDPIGRRNVFLVVVVVVVFS